ncbi:MAG: hypothetical protein ACYC7E_02630 [Armatimonadota bacterium]
MTRYWPRQHAVCGSTRQVTFPPDPGKPETTNYFFATAEDKLPPEKTLIVDEKYYDSKLTFDIPTGMLISIIGYAQAPAKNGGRFLLDYIVIRQLEANTDE